MLQSSMAHEAWEGCGIKLQGHRVQETRVHLTELVLEASPGCLETQLQVSCPQGRRERGPQVAGQVSPSIAVLPHPFQTSQFSLLQGSSSSQQSDDLDSVVSAVLLLD